MSVGSPCSVRTWRNVDAELDCATFAFEQWPLLVGVHGEHAAAIAVVDPELQFVALDDDTIADGEAAAGQLQLAVVKLAGVAQRARHELWATRS
jgi:hypothetical protein